MEKSAAFRLRWGKREKGENVEEKRKMAKKGEKWRRKAKNGGERLECANRFCVKLDFRGF